MSLRSKLATTKQTPDFQKRPSHWLPSPQMLVEGCANLMVTPPSEHMQELFAQMGVPSLDLMVTALSSRVGLLAAARGQAYFHHELRGRLPMPRGLEPERVAWEEGTLPVWEEGILTEPKYFSFFLDAPFSPYNPNHRRKWRAHELLHGVVGIFWSPQMTRFEAYMGARLDELLPIIHWYGLDEIYRPRCEKHQGQQLYRELCPDCEGLARPYHKHDTAWVEAQTTQACAWASQAWAHFDEEWKACLYELNTGQRCPTPRVHLDASSDAMGYLYCHWPRLTSWSFGSWVERFLHDGFDYFSTIPAYMQHIATCSHDLVSGECEVEMSTWQRLRTRRVLQDIGYRCFLSLEWLEDGSKAAYRAEDAMMPLLEQAAKIGHDLLTVPVENQDIDALIEAINTTFVKEVCSVGNLPKELQQNFAMLGYLWPKVKTPSLSSQTMITYALPQLKEGLETGYTQSWPMVLEQQIDPCIEMFAASPIFQLTERLTTRYSQWYGVQDNPSDAVLEWMRFEAWIQKSPHRDEDAECFSVLPESITELAGLPGVLRSHQTLRRANWSAMLLEQLLGEKQEEAACLAAIHHNGQQRLLLLGSEMTKVLDTVAQSQSLNREFVEAQNDALVLLLENSFIAWFPAPQK